MRYLTDDISGAVQVLEVMALGICRDLEDRQGQAIALSYLELCAARLATFRPGRALAHGFEGLTVVTPLLSMLLCRVSFQLFLIVRRSSLPLGSKSCTSIPATLSQTESAREGRGPCQGLAKPEAGPLPPSRRLG